MKRFRHRPSSLAPLGALLLSSWSAYAQETPSGTPNPESVAPAPTTEVAAAPAPSPEPAAPSLAAPSLAEPGSAEPSSSAPNPSASATQGPIFVTVSITGYAVQASDVATAIARELNVALSSVPGSARSTFEVVITRDKDLSITYRDYAGRALTRVVKAPTNDSQVSEVAALLAVNLSQDKSDEVLAQLTPPPKPDPVAPAAAAEPLTALDPGSKPLAPELDFVVANGTAAYPLSIVRDVDQRSVGFELGLFYSRVGAVNGVAINALLLHSLQTTDGVMLAGLGTVAGNGDYHTPQEGARVAGLFNYGRGPFEGVGVAGVVDFEYVDEGAPLGVEGVQVAGVFAGVNGNVEGSQVAGVATYSHALDGVQVGGVANVARGRADGGQIAGVVNYSEAVAGTQIGGVANIAPGDVQGLQLAGGVNVAGNVDGAQIGVINIGKRVKGAQIGLVNIAEEVDGASVGLVTYSKKGQTQLTTWFDSTRPVNIGARFVTGPLYALPMVGGDPTKTDEFAFGFSLGARVPVERLYFDLEGNTSSQFKDGSVDESAMDLRYRAAVGFRVLPWLGVFAGGGVRHQFHAKDGGDHRLRGIWNVGVDVF